MLVRVTAGIMVQAFHMAIFSSEGDVVKAADCESGLCVGRADETFLCGPI